MSCWSSSKPVMSSKGGCVEVSSTAPLSFFFPPGPPAPDLSSELGTGGGWRGRRGNLEDLQGKELQKVSE